MVKDEAGFFLYRPQQFRNFNVLLAQQNSLWIFGLGFYF
jgi:hypothetical protein